MREEFEKLVAAGKIGKQHVAPLVILAQGGYCQHKSWGFGKITTVDTVFSRLTVDFHGKPGHSMDLGFAADSLKAIPSDHILARKASDINALRQMAALHHLDLIKLVLQSYAGRATLDQIQQVLVPDIIADDWKKWWEAAKREMKKDGHFQLPVKKTDPITYQANEVSLQDRLLTDFRAAKGLKAKIAVATEVQRSVEDLGDKKTTVAEVVTALNADITSHQRTQAALALEGIFLRDELREAADLTPSEGDVTAASVWGQSVRLAQLLEQMPAAKHRRALQSFKEATPDRWVEEIVSIINTVSSKLCGECANLLISESKLPVLKDLVARLINQHAASSDLLLWLAKERSDAYADIIGPEVFRAMLTAIERDQFNERKSTKLSDFIMDDQELLVELIGSADIEVIKDLTRALQLSPCFDDMDKRSLLARIVKSYPVVQSLITGDQGSTSKQESLMIVSWDSLGRRKAEYEELVQKKIPANSKEIAIARSYGDLRENHEYKAAKEMQKILMRRKAELESQLGKARGTDFANARTDIVSIGTRVQITNLETSTPESFSILGAWDTEPEKGIISYLTPVAQGLLNKPVGDVVEVEVEGSRRKFRINAIEPVVIAPPAEPAAEPQA